MPPRRTTCSRTSASLRPTNELRSRAASATGVRESIPSLKHQRRGRQRMVVHHPRLVGSGIEDPVPGSWDANAAYRCSVTRMFDVSSDHDRGSIELFGLDWSRMSGVPGIAGSREPEVEGIFVSPDYFTAEFLSGST